MTLSGQFSPPPRQTVVYGKPVATALPAALESFGAKRVVMVTTNSLSAPGKLGATVAAALGARCMEIVTGIGAHSPRGDVLRIMAALRKHDADAVVGFGGGSVCDAVKVAAFGLANQVERAEQFDALRAPSDATGPTLPYIMIPTTLSAGEFTHFAGVTDERGPRKELYIQPDLAPDLVILDPALTLATPPRLWFSTGIRAVDHAVESWCSINVTPPIEATSLHALRLLTAGLRGSLANPDDLDMRLQCQLGSWLSVQGVSTGVDLGASHGIGHVLGGTAGMPHGETSCVMMPHVLRYNIEQTRERQRLLAEAMGAPGTPAADIVQKLVADLGLPGRLRDANVPRELLPKIAEESMHDLWVKTNPRPISGPPVVLELLEAAW
ncbi:MAG: iron-containing alcohol dehydrogenase [Proteobacteria bacterium]|nr:iron-containing alcohol dehydrogenase [Pseudomonadota bacterium]